MGHGVVADKVPSGLNGAHDIWPLTDKTPDHEEGSAYFVLIQDFEELPSVGIVGSIIESKSDFIGITARYQGPSEELRTGGE